MSGPDGYTVAYARLERNRIDAGGLRDRAPRADASPVRAQTAGASNDMLALAPIPVKALPAFRDPESYQH